MSVVVKQGYSETQFNNCTVKFRMKHLFSSRLLLVIILTISSVDASGYPDEHPAIIPDMIVDLINSFRNSTNPLGCDICQIEWEDALAQDAQMETNCQFSRGQNTQPDSYHAIDTNVEVLVNIMKYDVVETAVRNWGSVVTTQVYRQLVNADTCKVGCASRFCGPISYILRCYFDPPSQTTGPFFTTGSLCTCCPSGRPFCGPRNLCSSSSSDSGPDMMIGSDPHFSVRLPSGQLLCFTVQGEVGSIFNLISTDTLEMNALFKRLADHPKNTWLGEIGITVAGKQLTFDSMLGIITIANKVSFDSSAIQKITIDDRQLLLTMADEQTQKNQVEVDVRQLNLKFTVIFVNEHLDMLWSSGGTDNTHIHGLLGQFLHSSVAVDEQNELLIIPGRASVPVERQQLYAFIRSEALQYKDESCWTAVKHSNQGIGVIDGTYSDYRVDSLLATGFKFGVLGGTVDD